MKAYRTTENGHGHSGFSGRPLASVNDRMGTADKAPWIELTLYRNTAGHYILAATLHASPKPGPGDLHQATTFSSALDLIRALRLHGRGLGEMVEKLLEAAARSDPSFYVAMRRSRLPQPSRIRSLGETFGLLARSRLHGQRELLRQTDRNRTA